MTLQYSFARVGYVKRRLSQAASAGQQQARARPHVIQRGSMVELQSFTLASVSGGAWLFHMVTPLVYHSISAVVLRCPYSACMDDDETLPRVQTWEHLHCADMYACACIDVDMHSRMLAGALDMYTPMHECGPDVHMFVHVGVHAYSHARADLHMHVSTRGWTLICACMRRNPHG